LDKSHKEEEKRGLMRNAKRSQGRKMRYIGKFSRDEQGPERPKKRWKKNANGRSGHSIMRK
jgi:hypothetical protein